ncbi:MAG TPA: ECF-type sigma factor [Gemmatimonadales bacterium]|nr:ECF-type sigma factor [Gemmatimonadales bacterium]
MSRPLDPSFPVSLQAEGRLGGGSPLEQLFPLVYEELRALARRHRRRQGETTLSTTDVVHEVFLRLVEGERVGWHDRAHFFALASRAMRFILVDRARARSASKRGGGMAVITLVDGDAAIADRSNDLLAIDEALERLEARSSRLALLVQYRFFGGMSYPEIAEVTGVSVPTTKRDWARARTWLYRFMAEGAEPVA